MLRPFSQSSFPSLVFSLGHSFPRQVCSSGLGMNLKPRKCVSLEWGLLYTQEQLEIVKQRPPGSPVSTPPSSAGEDWPHLVACAMTSMVISLDFIRMLSDFYQRGAPSLSLRHHLRFLGVIEGLHWHARSFNEDQTLRAALRTRAFMRFPDSPGRLPNLLEQEVNSATLLVTIAVKIFGDADPALHEAGEPFVKRYFSIVVNRFMDLDDTLNSANPVSTDLVAAYKPAVVSGLRGLCCLSLPQFRACLPWLGPLITRLITCHDLQVRQFLKQLHELLFLPSCLPR